MKMAFIVDPALWSEDIVEVFAKLESVEQLTEKHWKVINYLRDYFQKFGIAPMIRKLCKDTGFTLKEIYELFPIRPRQRRLQISRLTQAYRLRMKNKTSPDFKRL